MGNAQVAGNATSERIDREFVHPSDRGSRCASHDGRDAMDQAGIPCSRSRRGSCCDDAAAESGFGTLEMELLYSLPLQTGSAAFGKCRRVQGTSKTLDGLPSAHPLVGNLETWLRETFRGAFRKPSAEPYVERRFLIMFIDFY